MSFIATKYEVRSLASVICLSILSYYLILLAPLPPPPLLSLSLTGQPGYRGARDDKNDQSYEFSIIPLLDLCSTYSFHSAHFNAFILTCPFILVININSILDSYFSHCLFYSKCSRLSRAQLDTTPVHARHKLQEILKYTPLREGLV